MAFGPAARANVGSLVIERLEPRHTLAGNLTAYVSGGTLVVQGDDRGAQITISQPAPGHITVSGTDTTIKGSLNSMAFAGVTRNLFLRLGMGSDRLTIDQTAPIVIRGDVDIASGVGGDAIFTLASPAGVLRVGGNVRLRTVSGTREFGNTSLENRADCGTSVPPQDAATADRGKPRLFHRSAKWKKVMDDFFHGQLDVKGDLRIQTVGQGGLVWLGGGGGTGMVSRIGGSVWIVNATRDAASAGLSSLTVGGDVSITNRGWAAVPGSRRWMWRAISASSIRLHGCLAWQSR